MKLSPQEKTVIAMTAEGLTAKQVARHMNLSVSAVNLYLSKARLKLGAMNTSAAVALAVRNQII